MDAMAFRGFKQNEFRKALVAIGLVILVSVIFSSSAQAQSLRDTVKDHVRKQLDLSKQKQRQKAQKEKEKQEKKRVAPKENQKPKRSKTERSMTTRPKAPKPNAARPKPAAKREPAEDVAGKKKKKSDKRDGEKPEMPRRAIGEDLQIDLKLGCGYRGWLPQQYPTVDVDMASYFTWTIAGRAKIYKWLAIHHAYYESTGLAGPRTEGATVAARISGFVPGAAWLLGVLGFPFLKVWEPIIRYESRAFDTTARPRGNGVCIVTDDFEGDPDDCSRTTEPLRLVSGFETLVAGVRYNLYKDPSPVIRTPEGDLSSIFFGVGLMSYTKPYQVTIDGATLPELLFDGRFRGAGLALGANLGGGADNYYANLHMQLGLGEVSLTDDLTLNELAPEGWLMGYLQGTATIGYRLPLWRFAPTLMFVPSFTGGGASFFFFETEPEEGESGTTAGVNWDFLWSVRGALVLSL